jgi:DNA polymerase III subunit alpha
MAQFADYGFNRSHSVAYAYLAFQTAYLKAHYPAYFYASVLSSESQDTAKIYKYSSELKQLSVKLLPPDVNESDGGFTPLNDTVRFGLTAIKGLGASTVEAIMEARKAGKFTTLYDFVSKIQQGSISRRGLESLISAGAFDSLMPTDHIVNLWRARLFAGIDGSLSHAQRAWNDKLKGQTMLFGAAEDDLSTADEELPQVTAWTQQKLTQEEKGAVGFYLSNHPLDDYDKLLSDLKINKIADFTELENREAISIAGIVSGLQVKYSKKGNRFAVFRLEDQSNGVKCLVWAEAFAKISHLLENDRILILSGKVETSEGQEFTLFVDEAQSLDDALPLKSSKVFVTFSENKLLKLDDLFELMSRNISRGAVKCDVYIDLVTAEDVTVRFLSQLRIQGSKALEKDLIEKGCKVRWELN